MIGGSISGGIPFAYDATDACVPFGLPIFPEYLVIIYRI